MSQAKHRRTEIPNIEIPRLSADMLDRCKIECYGWGNYLGLKLFFNQNIVKKNVVYDGKVIVKSDSNCAGGVERVFI